MVLGIVGTISWLMTLALATPVALYGVRLLWGGDTLLGVVFLALAGLMLFLPEYLERQVSSRLGSTFGRLPLVGRGSDEE